MSQGCVDCHFFVKHHRGEDGRELTFEVSPEERELRAYGITRASLFPGEEIR